MDIEILHYYWLDIILPAVGETVFILFFTMLIDITIGFVLALLLYATEPEGIYPMAKLYTFLNVAINIIRSIPSVICIVVLLPVARIILGSAIGNKAAIIYISIMCAPFMGRVFEQKFRAVDRSLLEAAQSMGMSNMQILLRFIVHDAAPSMVLGISFGTIMIMGMIAFAGLIGAGGIGSVALNYGYNAFNSYVLYNSIFVMFLLTGLIQVIGRVIYNRMK